MYPEGRGARLVGVIAMSEQCSIGNFYEYRDIGQFKLNLKE